MSLRMRGWTIICFLWALGGCQQILGVEDVRVTDAGLGPGASRVVAGSMAGLSPGDFAELSLNEGPPHAVSQNGSFVFPGFLVDGNDYDVQVVTQPGHLACVVEKGSGTVGGGNVMDIAVTCSPAQRSIGGSVTGLGSGEMVSLQLNAETPIPVGNGAFTFPSGLNDADVYSVVVSTQPATSNCAAANGSGVINGADVSDIAVSCLPVQRTVGGRISGLGGGQEVQLSLNGADTRTLDRNGLFLFSTTLEEGDTYTVAIDSQTTPLDCGLTGATGSIAGASIDTVVVDCSPDTLVVSGNATGVVGGVVALSLNGSETLSVASDGAFVFATAFADGNAYAVSIESVPDTLECSLGGESGTVGAVDVTGVVLSCAPAEFVVGGTVQGLGDEQIELSLNGSESLVLSDDGAFAFAGTVASGNFYSVAITNQPPSLDCELINGAGSMGAANVDTVVVTCVPSALLTSLGTSFLSSLNPNFEPEVANYALSVSVLGQELVLTPTAADPNATIIVDGSPTVSGQSAAPVPLALGTNLIPVQVTAQSGAVQNYLLEVERGAGLGQVAYGKSPVPDLGDQFGFSVALSGDTLVVGMPLEDSNASGIDGDPTDNSADNSGAVFVFRRIGGTWQQEAYLKASNAEAVDQFGVSVSIDGDTIAVGANTESGGVGGINVDQTDNSADNSGAVYVFTRSGTTWTQEAYIKATVPHESDLFGSQVFVEGATLAVSAHGIDSASVGINGDETNVSAPNSGAVFIFTRSDTTWTQEAYIKASNAEANDNFGASFGLSGDTLAVGAGSEASSATGIDGDQNNNDASQSGAVYVFVRSGATWSQQAYIKASNTSAGESFARLALSRDTLVVAATGEDSSATGVNGDQQNNDASNAGAVYVFTRAGSSWSQQAYLKASNTEALDGFGTGLAIQGDFVAISAVGEDSSATGINGNDADNGAPSSGAVYLFQRTGDAWAQHSYIKASNTAMNDGFGLERGLVLAGETLTVGAVLEDSGASGFGGDQSDNSQVDSGAIYIFQ